MEHKDMQDKTPVREVSSTSEPFNYSCGACGLIVFRTEVRMDDEGIANKMAAHRPHCRPEKRDFERELK